MRTSDQQQIDETTSGTGRTGPLGSTRRLVTTVGVVVTLVAAIALAGSRGWTVTSGGSATAAADPLAPEIQHSREGAQSAAAKMGSAMGAETFFTEQGRHDVLQRIADPDRRSDLIKRFDASYSPAFFTTIGLGNDGQPPAGATFVSRALPAGTTVRHYDAREAVVEVWCSAFLGITGKGVQDEIRPTANWVTMTITLHWTEGGWRLAAFAQSSGPDLSDADASTFGAAPQL